LGSIFNQGSTFAFAIVAANLLGRETFGEYGIVASAVVALSQVAQLACGHTATKYVAEYRLCDRRKTGRIIGILLKIVLAAATLVLFGLLASVRWLASSLLRAPELRIGLTIGSGVIFLNVLIGYFMGVLAGLEAYRKLSRALVQFGIFYFLACTIATWTLGLNGAFLGLLSSSLFGCAVLYLALRSECRAQGIQIQFGYFPEVRTMLTTFALPNAFSGLTFLPALWLGSAILVRQPHGYSQMALFSAAYTVMTAVLFVPNITYIVGWSLLNHQRGQGESRLYRSTYLMNLIIAGAAVVLGSLVFAILGAQILRLFGKDFSDGYKPLLTMLGAAIPQALGLAALQHLLSQERMWLSFFAVILPRDVLFLTLANYLIPHYGAAGLAWAYAAAWTVALMIIAEITYGIGIHAGLDTAQAPPQEL
jgi:O-antigen/teichoic acid export membrane protein